MPILIFTGLGVLFVIVTLLLLIYQNGGLISLEFMLYDAARRLDKLKMGIAWLMPRWLVYWCAVRLISHATTGKYSHADSTEIRAMTALRRWEHK